MTPYGDTDLGLHWLRQWFAVWWHQATTWNNVYSSSVRSSDIHLSISLQCDTSATKHANRYENLVSKSPGAGQKVDLAITIMTDTKNVFSLSQLHNYYDDLVHLLTISMYCWKCHSETYFMDCYVCVIDLSWQKHDLSNNVSSLVQVMAWCYQNTSLTKTLFTNFHDKKWHHEEPVDSTNRRKYAISYVSGVT